MTDLSKLQNTHTKKRCIQRVGRGVGSGRGKTSCRGHKGAKSRSGYKRRSWQEGGGVPLFKRLPTRGFNNAQFSTNFETINIDDIEKFFKADETVSLDALRKKGLLKGKREIRLKILGRGALKKAVKVEAHSVSSSAKEKLEKAGAKLKILEGPKPAPAKIAKALKVSENEPKTKVAKTTVASKKPKKDTK